MKQGIIMNSERKIVLSILWKSWGKFDMSNSTNQLLYLQTPTP